MNVWLIGSGIYAITLLFALALCRVAAPTSDEAIQTGAGATKPTNDGTEYEHLIDHGGYATAAVSYRGSYDDQSHAVPASRPSMRSQRRRHLRRDSRSPQPSPSADTSPAPQSLHQS